MFVLDRDPELNRLKLEIVKHNNRVASGKRITGYLHLTSASELYRKLPSLNLDTVKPVLLKPKPVLLKPIKPVSTTGCLLPTEQKITTTVAQDYQTVKNSLIEEQTSLSEFKEKYQLGKLLGQGSYGKIYQGVYRKEKVVFKVVEHNEDTGFEGFVWECVASQRAAMLGVGPGVVAKIILKKGKKMRHYVIVMKQCSPLTQIRWSKKDSVEIYRMLSKLHSNGIVHRDLGVRNLMKSGDRLVFIDYGLAFVFDSPVPAPLRLLDHAVMGQDMGDYFEYLLTHYKEKDLISFDSPLKMDTVSLEEFPLPMLRTLRDNSEYYLNNTKGGDAVIVARQLGKRLKALK